MRAATRSNPASVIQTFCAGFLAAWVLAIAGFVGALLQFHLYLIFIRDQTTNEFLRGEHSATPKLRDVPFKFINLCCSPIPSSKLGATHKPPESSYRAYISSAYTIQHNRIEALITQSSRCDQNSLDEPAPATPPSPPDKPRKRSTDAPAIPLLSTPSPMARSDHREENDDENFNTELPPPLPCIENAPPVTGGIALV
eukprot:CAMPEP_0197302720 /NCGR_PEP_ID=MMETSP0890-20130614/51232_1 /TAXON_ID=44058 ORGANISM="Aureoumbra lagunensis, Strain CCMP1510" /NCGR_SAMPLE_ID=MMETSP0890 /ASSEMBLY_ACC=CAM_ASM_000533 /LENGTH=197 /DNA_ID=CAMNT_0042782401 /DNA_START=224 /DNA_END=817 /DNA_ORIENTATION=-